MTTDKDLDVALRLTYDDRRVLVFLMAGNACLDALSLYEFEQTCGFRAASQLLRDVREQS